MKKVIALVLTSVIFVCAFAGCTVNQNAREFGVEETVTLPPNEKLTDIEWEGADLWYMTRPMREDEVAETYTFKESSTYGVLEGTITIVESKG